MTKTRDQLLQELAEWEEDLKEHELSLNGCATFDGSTWTAVEPRWQAEADELDEMVDNDYDTIAEIKIRLGLQEPNPTTRTHLRIA